MAERLINVDELGVGRCSKDVLPAAYCAGWNGLLGLIENALTVDAVVVTRCKDCKHYLIADEFKGGKRYMCEVNHFSYLNSDGDMHFYSYGEPKEGTYVDDHD